MVAGMDREDERQQGLEEASGGSLDPLAEVGPWCVAKPGAIAFLLALVWHVCVWARSARCRTGQNCRRFL
jgi:hypothetical protein